jgi:energy-converting hydrogenase Eha subunit C
MINVLKWVATIVTIAGAIATALMIDPLNIWLLNLGAFPVFDLGCPN